MHTSSTNLLLVNHELISPLTTPSRAQPKSDQHTWRDTFMVSTLTTLLISISALAVYLVQTFLVPADKENIDQPTFQESTKPKLIVTIVLENTVFWSPTPNAKQPMYAFIAGTKKVLLHDLAQNKHLQLHLIGNLKHRAQLSSLLANAGVYAYLPHGQIHWADPSTVVHKVMPDVHIAANCVNDLPPCVKTFICVDSKCVSNSSWSDSAVKLLPTREEDEEVVLDSTCSPLWPDQACSKPDAVISVSNLSDWHNRASMLGQWVHSMDLSLST